MTHEFRIYVAPILVPDGENWVAGLGDVQVRGRTELEARERLRARLAELDRRLRSIVVGPAAPGIARWLRRQDGSLAE